MSKDNKAYQQAIEAYTKFRQGGSKYVKSLNDSELGDIQSALAFAVGITDDELLQRDLKSFQASLLSMKQTKQKKESRKRTFRYSLMAAGLTILYGILTYFYESVQIHIITQVGQGYPVWFLWAWRAIGFFDILSVLLVIRQCCKNQQCCPKICQNQAKEKPDEPEFKLGNGYSQLKEDAENEAEDGMI